jgi:hypothetical protein
MPALARVQVEQSDVISFHNYGWPEEFDQKVKQLDQFHRPLICTEYMARGAGSTFDTILPIARQYHVGAINWGLVAGNSQTYLPRDSWQRPYVNEQPTVSFHDVFYPDGKPYRQREAEIIHSLTSGKYRSSQGERLPATGLLLLDHAAQMGANSGCSPVYFSTSGAVEEIASRMRSRRVERVLSVPTERLSPKRIRFFAEVHWLAPFKVIAMRSAAR